MRKVLMFLTALLSFGLAACGGSAATPTQPGPTTGRAVFAMSDAAADMGSVTAVKVTIDSLRVHAEGGAWTTVSTGTKTYDLLELNAKGTAQLLAQASLDAGTYDQIELNVSLVVVVDAKGEHEAKLPSNKLQIRGTLDVKANTTATANFDFIAHQSLHLTGEGTYILAPVIKLETRAEAQAQVQTNNEVRISGGQTTSQAQVGMNAEGTVDTGLRIAPDAVVSIAASGKVVQTKGQALVHGTVKAVDTATGTVTFTTKGGVELVLHTSGDSSIKVGSSAATVVDLAANIGSEAAVRYNAETKTIAAIAARADANAKAEIGSKLELSGTVTSVNAASGTVTITADSGANVVVKVGPEVKVDVGGNAVGLAGLGSLVGARVEGQFNADTGQAGELHASAEAKASVSGVLKAVDVATGTVTISTHAGADVVLKVGANAKVMVNGSASTLATLAANIGAQVTAEYDVQTKAATSIAAQGQAQAQATASVSGTLKAVNALAGTVTIATQTGADVVLNVAADTKLLLDGTVATLASPAATIGSQVQAEYNVQTKVANSIKVQSQAPAPTPTPPTAASISGTLKAVNAVAGTVTITTQARTDVVLKVAADTKVLLDSSVSTLATLAANISAQVTAEYNVQTQTATGIEVHSQAQAKAGVSGTLKAVDVVAGTVTIATQAGANVVLKVAADTKLRLDGTVSTLATLAANIGAQVTAEYDVQTKAATSITAQGQAQSQVPAPTPTPAPAPAPATASVSGTLKAANVLTGTVTIATQAGADVVLNVSSSTQVLINGSVSALATLAANVGAQVTAEYDVQTKAATSITVQGQAQSQVPAPTPTLAPATAAASASGTLKAVNVAAGTVTIATQAGADVMLSVTSSTQVLVNGSISGLATLATNIGAQVTATYNVQTKTAIKLVVGS